MLYARLVALAHDGGLDVFEQPALPEQGCYAAQPGRRAVLLVRAELANEEKLLVVARGLGLHSSKRGTLFVQVVEAEWCPEVEAAEMAVGMSLREGGRG